MLYFKRLGWYILYTIKQYAWKHGRKLKNRHYEQGPFDGDRRFFGTIETTRKKNLISKII